MKTLIALAGSLVLAGSASASFVEVIAVDQGNANPDLQTWRFYAQFDNAADQIGAFAGIEGMPLYWNSFVGGIYNNDGQFGMGHVQDIPFGNLDNIDEDTWLTLGQVGGFDFSQVNFSPDFLGIPGGETLQVLTDGLTSFYSEDSAVFIPGPAKVVTTWGDEEAPYDVAIAQFSVPASVGAAEIMEFGGIVQWVDPDGNVFQDGFYVLVPSPGALALLGLAGLIGRRRR